MQRTNQLARRRVPSIEGIRGRDRVRVDDGDRVDRRTLFVVRVDTTQVGLDERVTGQRPRPNRPVNRRDGCFVDPELTR